MSVLIENMIIPPEGKYPITLYVCSDGTAYIDAWSFPQDCDKFPVVSVAQWKWIEDWETGYSECSVCHESFLWEDFKGVADWNFCPNCGAKMDAPDMDFSERDGDGNV